MYQGFNLTSSWIGLNLQYFSSTDELITTSGYLIFGETALF